MRAIFAGEEMVGTKIFAAVFSVIAAKATAVPWLPPDAATTPAAGTSRVSRFVKAPRVLNDPARCSSSSLNVTRNPATPTSAPSTSTTGVRRNEPGHAVLADRPDPDAVTPVRVVVRARLRVDHINGLALDEQAARAAERVARLEVRSVLIEDLDAVVAAIGHPQPASRVEHE